MSDVQNYIDSFDGEAQKRLIRIREICRHLAPESVEKISYGIPTVFQNGVIIHFAAFKNHIGIYALPETHERIADDLKLYKTGKGSVQFPLSEPFPEALIEKIVKLRLEMLR